jgi:hypothetical protein
MNYLFIFIFLVSNYLLNKNKHKLSPQKQFEYNNFADCRNCCGIKNYYNVISNIIYPTAVAGWGGTTDSLTDWISTKLSVELLQCCRKNSSKQSSRSIKSSIDCLFNQFFCKIDSLMMFWEKNVNTKVIWNTIFITYQDSQLNTSTANI